MELEQIGLDLGALGIPEPKQENKASELPENIRIRKLTPKECFRLQGFSDEDYEKAKNALNNTFYKGADRSGSQLYKQAGNSIVVNCLVSIIRKMI